jgi:hypothetical protein
LSNLIANGLTGYLHQLQDIKAKYDRDTARQTRLAHVRIVGIPIPVLSQDDPLPGGYLGTALTASLCPKAHLKWTREVISTISKAVLNTPLPPNIKQRLLLHGAKSIIMHTYCLMALSPTAITSIYYSLEATCRKIWRLPNGSPRAGLHAPHEEIGLYLPIIWEDYCAAATNSCTNILNYQGALGATARDSRTQAAIKFQHWSLELAFHSHRGGRPLCPSVVARNIATLLTADLHPLGGPKIWSGNELSPTTSSLIPITTDEDGCPTPTQPYTSANRILRRLTSFWECKIHSWAQVARRSPRTHPYMLSDTEILWANPHLLGRIHTTLQRALLYFRRLLMADSPENLHSLTNTLNKHDPQSTLISPRWQNLLCTSLQQLPPGPNPLQLTLDSKQPDIASSIAHATETSKHGHQSTSGLLPYISQSQNDQRNAGDTDPPTTHRPIWSHPLTPHNHIPNPYITRL